MPGGRKVIPGASPKRERQYEHIKKSALESGHSEERAKEIAARTVNAQRAMAGESVTTHGHKNPKHK